MIIRYGQKDNNKMKSPPFKRKKVTFVFLQITVYMMLSKKLEGNKGVIRGSQAGRFYSNRNDSGSYIL